MEKMNRRRMLSSSIATLGAGMTIGVGSVTASDEEPPWEGSGSINDYEEFTGIVDEKKDENESSTDELYEKNRNKYKIYVKTYLLEKFTNNSGSQMFHIAISAYGTSNNLEFRRQGVAINVSTGSLYPPADRERIAVCPDPGESSDPAIDNDLAWTAAKGAISLANPYAGAGIVAADLVAAATFNGGDESDENNRAEYNWEYTHDSVNGGMHNKSRKAGHVLDFFVKPVHNPYGADTAWFDITHYFGALDSYFDSDPRYPDNIVANEQSHSVSALEGDQFDPIIQSASSGRKEKLTEEEIESLGIPEEFRDGGEIYRSNMATMNTID